MTVVPSPPTLCVAVAPAYARPALHVSYHTLRRPPASAFRAAPSGKPSTRICDLALTSARVPTATGVDARLPASSPFMPSSSRTTPGLLAANNLRGGCVNGRARAPHHRARRPLRRFLAPALVWVVAAACDYDLWWRRGPWGAASAAAASSSSSSSSPETNAALLSFAWGRVAGGAVAYRRHFVCFHVLLGLALLSHIAVTVANPGFLQPGNQGLGRARRPERWCDRCERYKPPRAHHCGRCGACVARMDHHCAFAANCIGAGNHKQLLLLVVYAAACAAHAIFLYLRLPGRFPVVAPSFVFCWLCGLFSQQLYGIGVDAGIVDRLQATRSEHRAAERAEAPPPPPPPPHAAAAAAARLPAAAALASASPPLPGKNRSVHGFGAPSRRSDAVGAPAAWRERAEFANRPGASTITAAANETPAAGLPRGPLCGAAVDGDRGSGAIVRGASFCRALWSCLREEVLGEGPWVSWLVPTPARLSPAAEERVCYARR